MKFVISNEGLDQIVDLVIPPEYHKQSTYNLRARTWIGVGTE